MGCVIVTVCAVAYDPLAGVTVGAASTHSVLSVPSTTGLVRVVVVLSPSWPFALRPQLYTAPPLVSASE